MAVYRLSDDVWLFLAGIWGYCRSKRPSAHEALTHGAVANASTLGPFGNREREAVMGQPNGRSPIARLSVLVCPSAIVWAVGTVVVDSIYRMLAGWLRPHVSKERIERMPPFADGNASAAVVRVLAVVGIPTTLLHAVPAFIFRRVRFAMCGQMEAASGSASANQIRIAHGLGCSALAFAMPVRVAFFQEPRTHNFPVAKLFTSEVYSHV